jgi:indole-3-glycerol phosphate synthase
VQESREWVPPTGTLGEILAETRRHVAHLQSGKGRQDLKPMARPTLRRPPRLDDALRRQNVAVIAEVKRRSPSRGTLNATMSAGEQVARFERAGAAAISVLTERTRFGGSLDDLHDAALHCQLPLLKKDFHISPLQFREIGEASAALLIARALPPGELFMMLDAFNGMIETVVEVRTEHELAVALEFGARIIGVNARDLETLEVDDRVPARLIPQVPADVVAIWESGISTREDVERAAAAGADAVLVGSVLSLSSDPEELLATLTTVPRKPRG